MMPSFEIVSTILGRNPFQLVLHPPRNDTYMGLMERQFMQDQLTHRHNLEFLKNIGYMNQGVQLSLLGPRLDDQNDVGLGAVIDDDENGEVALANIIPVKGWPKTMNQVIKSFTKYRSGLSTRHCKNLYHLLGQNNHGTKEHRIAGTTSIPNRI